MQLIGSFRLTTVSKEDGNFGRNISLRVRMAKHAYAN